MGEQVRGHHRDLHAGLVESHLEAIDLGATIGVGRAEWNEIVVVEGDAVGPELGQLMHCADGIDRGTGGIAERITGLPTNGPQAEGEVVSGSGLTGHPPKLPAQRLDGGEELEEFVVGGIDRDTHHLWSKA